VSDSIAALLDHVRSYYQALNTGDPDRVAEHFTDDATHYYTRLGPHEGASTPTGRSRTSMGSGSSRARSRTANAP